MIKKTVFAAGLLAMLATSAYAEPKFYFRYASGGKTIDVSQPENPVEPEMPQPEKKGVLNISNGYLSHSDYNANGIIDSGDHVSVQWTLRNTGKGEIRGISTAATFLIEDRGIGGIVWSGGSTPLSCATTLAPGASVVCSTSMSVTAGMLPSSRSESYFSVFFGMSMPDNVDDITGDSEINSIPLGSEMLVEVSGSPNVFELPHQLKLGEKMSMEFDLRSGNTDPFYDYAIAVRIPELNTTIPANCGDTSTPDYFARCTASLPLTETHRSLLYAGFPDNYALSYEIIQTKMGGYPTGKKLAEYTLMEGPVQYGYTQLDLSSLSISAPAYLDGDFVINAMIQNNTTDYFRGWEYDIDLGLDVKLKNICPNNVNFSPNQTVKCTTTMKLTETQINTIKSFFYSSSSATLNYSAMLGKENGSESGVTTGPYGSFDISW